MVNQAKGDCRGSSEQVHRWHRESLPREAENIQLRKSNSVWLLRTNEIQMNDDDWNGTSGRISGVKRIQRQENTWHFGEKWEMLVKE